MIAAGGTGGHVYPALAVSEALTEKYPDVTFSFIGTVGGFERPLMDEALSAGTVRFAAYDEVQAGPIHGVNPLRVLLSAGQLAVGTVQALGLIGKRKPDAILLTGGWVGVPVALAAWLRRVPVLIYLPDVEPGLMIKTLRPLAEKVAVTSEDSATFFPASQMIVTGYPLRREVLAAVDQRAEAQKFFNLDPSRKTLFVFGGSRGAQTINNAVLAIARDLLADGVQLVHVTGTLDAERLQAEHKAMGSPADYHLYPYLHAPQMGLGFAAADLALCRAGASVLGELPLFGLPAILVPYPFAWRYQKVNADALVNRGAALHMVDSDMARDLLPTIRALFTEPDRLGKMRAASRALARPDGALRVGEALLKLVKA